LKKKAVRNEQTKKTNKMESAGVKGGHIRKIRSGKEKRITREGKGHPRGGGGGRELVHYSRGRGRQVRQRG